MSQEIDKRKLIEQKIEEFEENLQDSSDSEEQKDQDTRDKLPVQDR